MGYHFDDDFLFLGNRDEQYTGGLEVEFIGLSKRKKRKKSVLNPYPKGIKATTGVLGCKLYTPYNVSDSLVILNDRPFSSLIYGGLGYLAYNERLTKKIMLLFYVGLIGSELPGKVQAAIHTVGESPPALGWHNRISATERFVANVHFSEQTNWVALNGINFWGLNRLHLATALEINTGMYLNAIGGGVCVSFFNYATNGNALYNWKVGQLKAEKEAKIRCTAYFKPQWQFVIQNTGLQGLPWIDSPYVITNDILKREVWMLEGGINLNFKRFFMSYTVRAKSKEFTKYVRRWHSWAGVTMGVNF